MYMYTLRVSHISVFLAVVFAVGSNTVCLYSHHHSLCL